MRVLAVDPGPVRSAWVLYDGAKVLMHGHEENRHVKDVLWQRLQEGDAAVFEQVQSFGMPVGAEVFETVFWTGRFYELTCQSLGIPNRLPRRDVKLHLCASARAKDSNVRQALIDRFGGKDKAIGKKASPGPLYGVKADCWQALALAVTWCDLNPNGRTT